MVIAIKGGHPSVRYQYSPAINSREEAVDSVCSMISNGSTTTSYKWTVFKYALQKRIIVGVCAKMRDPRGKTKVKRVREREKYTASQKSVRWVVCNLRKVEEPRDIDRGKVKEKTENKWKRRNDNS